MHSFRTSLIELLDRGFHRRRERVGKGLDCRDLCPIITISGMRSAFEHYRKHRQEVIDPYAMEAELLIGQVQIAP